MGPLCCAQWELNELKAAPLGWDNLNYTKQYPAIEYELWYNHEYLVSLHIWNGQVHFWFGYTVHISSFRVKSTPGHGCILEDGDLVIIRAVTMVSPLRGQQNQWVQCYLSVGHLHLHCGNACGGRTAQQFL